VDAKVMFYELCTKFNDVFFENMQWGNVCNKQSKPRRTGHDTVFGCQLTQNRGKEHPRKLDYKPRKRCGIRARHAHHRPCSTRSPLTLTTSPSHQTRPSPVWEGPSRRGTCASRPSPHGPPSTPSRTGTPSTNHPSSISPVHRVRGDMASRQIQTLRMGCIPSLPTCTPRDSRAPRRSGWEQAPRPVSGGLLGE